jgi:hypothetical protein
MRCDGIPRDIGKTRPADSRTIPGYDSRLVIAKDLQSGNSFLCQLGLRSWRKKRWSISRRHPIVRKSRREINDNVAISGCLRVRRGGGLRQRDQINRNKNGGEVRRHRRRDKPCAPKSHFTDKVVR